MNHTFSLTLLQNLILYKEWWLCYI
jgi:hypothetical protein